MWTQWAYALSFLIATASCAGHSFGIVASARREVRGDAVMLRDVTVKATEGNLPAVPIFTPVDLRFTWPGGLQQVEFVEVAFCILESGRVEDVEVLRGAPQLVETATASVARWRLRPAVVQGRRVRTCQTALIIYDVDSAFDLTADFEVRYVRNAHGSVISGHETPPVEPGRGVVTRPRARRSMDVVLADDEAGPWFYADWVNVELCVDEKGSVSGLSVLNGDPLPYSRTLVDAARDWTFDPMSIDGTPLTVCGIEETFRVHVRPRRDVFAPREHS